jgi:hypothetical protein
MQSVATLKNLKYIIHFDLFNTFFGYYMITYVLFHRFHVFTIILQLTALTEMAALVRVSRKLCSISFFYVLFLTLLLQVMLGFITYSREELLDIRAMSTHQHYDQEYDFPGADPLLDNDAVEEGADGAVFWSGSSGWSHQGPHHLHPT